MYTFKEIICMNLEYEFPCYFFDLVTLHSTMEITVVLNARP